VLGVIATLRLRFVSQALSPEPCRPRRICGDFVDAEASAGCDSQGLHDHTGRRRRGPDHSRFIDPFFKSSDNSRRPAAFSRDRRRGKHPSRQLQRPWATTERSA
jgi:hypothetical protein